MADFIERSFARMVEKVSDYAIFLTDAAGVILTWNPAAEAMKGWSRDEAVGSHLAILYTEEDRRRDHPAHNLQDAARHGTFQESAWRQRKDGSLFWALVEIIAIHSDAGELEGFCKVTRDLTNLKRLEDSLRDADRRKDEFLAMLAHELRNPLAPVSAAAELLAMGKLDAAPAKKASQVIIRQVRHMTELVDDLLDVSRVARGQITLKMASLDMKTVVNSAIEQVRPLIESRQHTLAITLAPSQAYVKGDEKRLIQVVANLLNNAAKYTPPGGAIGVEMSASDDTVCIEVLDNGIGIDPGIQDSVFEMFEQVQVTSDRSKGGLGIGLALVRNLTHLHGGSVSCHSEGLGRGSRFSLCMPRLAQHQAIPDRRATERPLELPVAHPTLSLLVVDDNVDAADMLQFFLSTMGHRVRVAHTAKAALELVDASMPDACILDIGLPDSSGHALAAAIRKRAPVQPVLIALTGYGMSGDRHQASEAGFDHYFVKPADLDALFAVLNGVTPAKAGS